jgi:hypothetical protein
MAQPILPSPLKHSGVNKHNCRYDFKEGWGGGLPKMGMYYEWLSMPRDFSIQSLDFRARLLGHHRQNQRLGGRPRTVGRIRTATTVFQLLQIRMMIGRLPQMRQGLRQNRRSRCIAGRNQAVVHPAPLPAHGDDARPAEIGKVARDFWLAEPENLHKVADADFPFRDEVEKAKTRGIGQGAEEKVEREWFFFAGHGEIIYGLTDMSNAAYR